MYDVYRVRGGKFEERVLMGIETEVAAREQAERLQRRSGSTMVRYCVVPSQVGSPGTRSAQADMRGGTRRTKRQRAQKGPACDRPAASLATRPPQHASPRDTVASPAHPPRRSYWIECEIDGKYHAVKGSYRSLDAACDAANKLERETEHPSARYWVRTRDAGGDATPTTQTTVGRPTTTPAKPVTTTPPPRPAASKRVARSQRAQATTQPREKRTRQPRTSRWDDTYEARGDISLAYRTEEELGLGIPAQWGRGRRSRWR